MNTPHTIGRIGWSPDYKSSPKLPAIEELQPVEQRRLVRRDAYICVHCDGVYADKPVSQCDCLGALESPPPHFVKGSIDYILPNTPVLPPKVGSDESSNQ